MSKKFPRPEFDNADGRDGSPSRLSSDNRNSIASATPTTTALSEKSPYPKSPYPKSPYQGLPSPTERAINADGRDGSPSRPSSDARNSAAHTIPTATALSEKSPYQVSPSPIRKTLPHEIPPWVGDGAVFFITINCQPRGLNQLAIPARAAAIERSLRHQQSCSAWWVHLFLLMPDHIHALLSFSHETPMQQSMQNWKRYLARKEGIVWQRDFFDHRIRHDESFTEKWDYIRENPVRKGLVPTPDEWPYQWTSGRDGSPSRPSPDARNSTVHAIPTATALSEKSPYQKSPYQKSPYQGLPSPTERAINADGRDGSPSRPSPNAHLKKMGAAL